MRPAKVDPKPTEHNAVWIKKYASSDKKTDNN